MHETVITPPSPSRNPSGSVVLHDVSWKMYENLLRELGDYHVSLTYDRGNLEIMAPSPRHEFGKKMIARLLEAMADELYINIASAGSVTCKREDIAKGLEPDECYYLKNASKILNRER